MSSSQRSTTYNVELELRVWLENEKGSRRQPGFTLREEMFEHAHRAGVDMPYETLSVLHGLHVETQPNTMEYTGELAALSASAVWATASLIICATWRGRQRTGAQHAQVRHRTHLDARDALHPRRHHLAGRALHRRDGRARRQRPGRPDDRRYRLLQRAEPPRTTANAACFGADTADDRLDGDPRALRAADLATRRRHGPHHGRCRLGHPRAPPRRAPRARAREKSSEEEAGRQTQSHRKVGIAFGVTAAFCQATGNVLTKLGGGEISALEISVVRLVFGIVGWRWSSARWGD